MAPWKRQYLRRVLKEEWIVGVRKEGKGLPAMIHRGMHSTSKEGQMLGDEADRGALKDTTKRYY